MSGPVGVRAMVRVRVRVRGLGLVSLMKGDLSLTKTVVERLDENTNVSAPSQSFHQRIIQKPKSSFKYREEEEMVLGHNCPDKNKVMYEVNDMQNKG